MSTSSNENISPQVLRRVAKELTEMSASPPEGIKVYLNEEDMTDVQATIVGPAGTPYEGGVFRMKLVLSNDFPSAPPKGFFLTKIFHPNVSKTGEICVNTLKKDWKPEYGIAHVLMVVKCLLIHPNPESALNEEAGRLLLEQYDDYAKHARMMTSIHARPTKETAAATTTTPAAEEGSDATSASASAAAAAAGSAPAASAAAAAAAKKPAADKEKDKKKGLKRL